MARCASCNWKLDEKIYRNNPLGLRETLLAHAKHHEENRIINENFSLDGELL